MSASSIIKTLDVFKHGELGFCLSLKRASIQQLTFQGRPKISAIALSYASPTDPTDGITFISWHRLPKATLVYCVPRSE